MPEAASRADPIAARIMPIPTGDFRVTAPVSGQAEDGVAVTAAEVTGTCTVSCDAVGAVVITAAVVTAVVAVATLTDDTAVVPETVLPVLWKQ